LGKWGIRNSWIWEEFECEPEGYEMADVAWLVGSLGILTLIILIGVLVLWMTLKDKKSGFPLTDERIQQLNWKAAYYAMFLCQYFIVAYLVVNIVGREFFGMREIEAGYPMIAALLVSSVSFLVLRWYFGRDGEM
jgi:magnesium-transporting ATPase (P-type)